MASLDEVFTIKSFKLVQPFFILFLESFYDEPASSDIIT